LAPHLDPVQNMYLGREIRRAGLAGALGFMKTKEMARASRVAFDELGATVRALTSPVGEMSGGQRQAVAIARAVHWASRVVFLDEPTTGLDPTSRQALWEEVRRLNAELGTTVFLTTQYLEEADQLAGRVAIIDAGRLVREGTPTELKATVGAPTLRVEIDQEHVATTRDVMTGFGEERPSRGGRVAIGLTEGATRVAAVVRALDTAGVTVIHLELDAPSLDDVFAHATGRRLEGSGDEQ